MAAGSLVSIHEYLNTSYRPDRDYVDGMVLERNLGEYDHARLQTESPSTSAHGSRNGTCAP